jgi:hypothetical protein
VKFISKYNWLRNKFEKISNRKFFAISFAVPFLYWSLRILIKSQNTFNLDTYWALNEIDKVGLFAGKFDVLYPWLSTLITYLTTFGAKGMRLYGEGVTFDYVNFAILFMIITMSFALAYLALQINRQKYGSKLFSLFIVIIFSFFPLISEYVVSKGGKDTYFLVSLILFLALFLEILETKCKCLKDKKFISKFIIAATLVSLLRPNAIFALILFLLILLIVYKKYWKCIGLACVLLLITIFVVNLGATKIFNLNNSDAPNYEIQYYNPIGTQRLMVEYVYYNKLTVKEEQKSFFTSLQSADKWAEDYYPWDMPHQDGVPRFTKYSSGAFYKEDFINFEKNWFLLGLQHPLAYFTAFFDGTRATWDPIFSYCSQPMVSEMETYSIEKCQYISLSGSLSSNILHSFVNIVKSIITNFSLVFWIFIIFLVISIVKKKKDFVVLISLPLCYLFSILISFGSTWMFRYIYPIISCFIIIIPLMIHELWIFRKINK